MSSALAASPEARRRGAAAAPERVLALVPRAPRTALRLARRTLDGGAPLAPDDRARLLRAAGHALRAVGEYREARDAYRASRRLFRRLGMAFEHALGAIGLIDACMFLGLEREALAAAAEARRVFGRHRDARRLAMLETNVGNLHHRREALEAALGCYDRAATLLRARGSAVERAGVAHNRANCLTHLGRRRDAEALFRESLAAFDAAAQPMRAAQARYGIACLRFLSGEYAEAIAELEEVRPELQRLGARSLLAQADLDLADVLVAMRLHPEALVLARAAGRWFHAHGVPDDHARCELLAGLALAAMGRMAEAERALSRAERTFRRRRHVLGGAAVMLARARLLISTGHPLSAARAARGARAVFARAGFPLRAQAAAALAAEALLAAGRKEQARSWARAMLREPRIAGDAFSLARLARVRAAVAATAGETTVALEAYREALQHTRQASRTLFVDEWRVGFMDSEPALLDEALGALIRRRPEPSVGEVWDWIAEYSLPAGWAPVTRYRTAGSAVRERVEALRAELQACYGRLWRSQSGGSRRLGPGLARRIEGRALAIEGRLRRLAAAGAPYRRSPARRSGGRAAAAGVYLHYFAAGGRLGAIASLPGGRVLLPDLAPLEAVERLARLFLYQVEVGAHADQPLARHQPAMRERARAHLDSLAVRLLPPLLERIESFSEIRIVPYGPLYQVPFHALSWRGRPLVDHAVVAVDPTAGARPAGPARAGALVVARSAPGAEAVEDEARAVAAELEAGGVPVELALGTEATTERIAAGAARAALIHIAGHAVYRGEHPEFSALQLHGGWLHARDLARLPLAGASVVLSACETGPRGSVAGSEMLGLARGLVQAGAGTVVASLWRVEDLATLAFMRSLYGAWRSGGRLGEALRGVQRRHAAFDTDPGQWAPFCLIGDASARWPAGASRWSLSS